MADTNRRIPEHLIHLTESSWKNHIAEVFHVILGSGQWIYREK